MSNREVIDTSRDRAAKRGVRETVAPAEPRSFAPRPHPAPCPDLGERTAVIIKFHREPRRAPMAIPKRSGHRRGVDLESIARTTHEAIRAWCEFNRDFSLPPWDEAADWQKRSALDGVRFHLDHPDADDGATHEAWLEEKRREGWTYGPVKNAELKQHPCIVPFEELPMVQQFKDRLFRAIVRGAAG